MILYMYLIWTQFLDHLVLHLCIQAVYNNMSGSAFRRNNMARLHVFPGEEVEMLFNVSVILLLKNMPKEMHKHT